MPLSTSIVHHVLKADGGTGWEKKHSVSLFLFIWTDIHYLGKKVTGVLLMCLVTVFLCENGFPSDYL